MLVDDSRSKDGSLNGLLRYLNVEWISTYLCINFTLLQGLPFNRIECGQWQSFYLHKMRSSKSSNANDLWNESTWNWMDFKFSKKDFLPILAAFKLNFTSNESQKANRWKILNSLFHFTPPAQVLMLRSCGELWFERESC